ncbi:MAG: aldehyde ferredoxin oxidoreductase family protein [Candidatus Hadarchaeales archaeon]
MPAYMGKILRVDLSRGKIAEEEIKETEFRKFLGCRGLGARYLFEVRKGIDPLGPENKLIFMTGLLTGTGFPTAGRYDVVSKSPQTGFYGHSNSAGMWGVDFKRTGFDGIIFEGISPKPVYLLVEDGRAELRDAAHLWGKGVHETTRMLKEELGERFNISCIGPAGENLVRYASILNDHNRAAGRCGMGTVMGSKKLKAVAARGTKKVEVADPDRMKELTREVIELANQSMLKTSLETFGTNSGFDLVNAVGGMPTRNWQEGVFPAGDKINGPSLADKVLVGTKGCYVCPIHCARLSEVKSGPYACKTEGPEYESVGALGSMCGVDSMEAVTYAHHLCNDYGMDTISTGSSIAFAMECFEKGILTKEDTGGLELRFGDADLMVRLVHMIARREGIGNLLAEGTKRMSEKLGRGSERFAMHSKGLEFAAYDPRAAKIVGLSYATSNRGGCHINAYVQLQAFIGAPHPILPEDIRDPFFDPLSEDPILGRVVKETEDAYAAVEGLGVCKFLAWMVTADKVAEAVSAATGWKDFDEREFRKCGERIYNLERMFNVREGLNRSHDSLPKRLLEEPHSSGPSAGQVVHLEPMLDAYYQYRGWDKNGVPTREKLAELELLDLPTG